MRSHRCAWGFPDNASHGRLRRMRQLSAILILAASSVAAEAQDNSSAYTPFDLDKCKQIAAADEYVFEGSWLCKGYRGLDIFQSGADGRSYAAFGKHAADHCAARKTFNPFNTAL